MAFKKVADVVGVLFRGGQNGIHADAMLDVRVEERLEREKRGEGEGKRESRFICVGLNNHVHIYRKNVRGQRKIVGRRSRGTCTQ